MRSILPKALIACLLALAGCHVPLANRLVLPDQKTVVREQLTIHSDFVLPPRHRLLDELVAQRVDINRRLGLNNSEEPIHVYLFESEDRFKGFMKIYHPDFPDRRAFFVETDTKLSVYAHWGDRIAEDMRHEITHGYLHSAVQNLPLWLDEGLAEYYESPRNERGLNRSHVALLSELLRRESWRPDLKRLEQLDPEKDMSQNDYAEAWAWIHFLLESKPEYADLLRAYIADLRRNGVAAPLSDRVAAAIPNANLALTEHVLFLTAEKR
jgi:hypothetical protein